MSAYQPLVCEVPEPKPLFGKNMVIAALLTTCTFFVAMFCLVALAVNLREETIVSNGALVDKTTGNVVRTVNFNTVVDPTASIDSVEFIANYGPDGSFTRHAVKNVAKTPCDQGINCINGFVHMYETIDGQYMAEMDGGSVVFVAVAQGRMLNGSDRKLLGGSGRRLLNGSDRKLLSDTNPNEGFGARGARSDTSRHLLGGSGRHLLSTRCETCTYVASGNAPSL